MAMFSAYLDETGHSQDKGQRFVGIAGLIATAAAWEAFGRKWKATLALFKLPYFHMKEFAHSAGVFEGWRDNEARRQKLFGKLMTHMEAAHPVPFGAIVPLERLRSFTEEEQSYFKDPYYLCFQSIVPACSSILGLKAPEEQVALIFSDQVEFRQRALDIYENVAHANNYVLRSTPPIFRDMREDLPLQAADIVAYEMHKEFERQLYKPNAEPRFGYRKIIKMSDRAGFTLPLFRYFSKPDLAAHIESIRRIRSLVKEHVEKLMAKS